MPSSSSLAVSSGLLPGGSSVGTTEASFREPRCAGVCITHEVVLVPCVAGVLVSQYGLAATASVT